MSQNSVEQGTAPNQFLKEVNSPEPGEFVDVAFFNAQDGQKGRDGGPYLDYEERFHAEVRRAAVEGREAPEYGDNVPAIVGTTLVTAPYVVDNSLTSNPSMAYKSGIEQALNDQAFQENSNLADPVSVLPVQAMGEPVVVDEDETPEEPVVEETPVEETPVTQSPTSVTLPPSV